MIEGRDFAAASTVGARQRQEDDWGTHENPPAQEGPANLLAVVADGIGGMPAGDQASVIALRAFLDSYLAIRCPARERLRHALAHANREVGIAIEADPELTGMGCTLVAVLFFRDRCEWLSIGDSFILHCRNGNLERINPLHIYANELDERVRRGELSVEAAKAHPDRPALTSAVQGTVLEEVAQGELRLEVGDVVVLASDGIATLNDEEIASICIQQSGEGAVRIAGTIIESIDTRAREGQDNATVVVFCQGEKDSTVALPNFAQAKVQEKLSDEETSGVNDMQKATDSEFARNTQVGSVLTEAETLAGSGEETKESVHSSKEIVRQREPVTEGVPGGWQPMKFLVGTQALWLVAIFVLGAVCGVAACFGLFMR